MAKVDAGSNKKLFWALLMGRQHSLHEMPFIFHEQSASKAVGALHQKPETHDYCLNGWPANKRLWGSLAVDLRISCCPFMHRPSDETNHIWESLCKTEEYVTIPPLLCYLTKRLTTIWLSCQDTTSVDAILIMTS